MLNIFLLLLHGLFELLDPQRGLFISTVKYVHRLGRLLTEEQSLLGILRLPVLVIARLRSLSQQGLPTVVVKLWFLGHGLVLLRYFQEWLLLRPVHAFSQVRQPNRGDRSVALDLKLPLAAHDPRRDRCDLPLLGRLVLEVIVQEIPVSVGALSMPHHRNRGQIVGPDGLHLRAITRDEDPRFGGVDAAQRLL